MGAFAGSVPCGTSIRLLHAFVQLRFDQLLLFTMDCAPELERCNELWFDDETVVLQAENVIFRVYMGILIRHSEFFQ